MSYGFIFRIFFPFALGYFISNVFFAIHAVLGSYLIADLSLSAGSLGLLTSIFFGFFAFFQLPLGVLLDRYGARRVNSFLLIFASLGCIFFAVSESLSGLLFGRGLIGLGVSGCLMAAFKAYSDWFPSDRLSLAYGCHLGFGGLGALSATFPVWYVMPFMGWRGIFWFLAFLSGLISVLIFVLVPRRCGGVGIGDSFMDQFRGFSLIFRSRLFWRVAPLAASVQAAALSELNLWTGPWLRDVGLFSESSVAVILFWIAFFLLLGFFLTGLFSDYVRRFGISLFSVWLWLSILCMVVQFLLLFSGVRFGIFLWMLFAFLSCSVFLPYAFLSVLFPLSHTGRLITSLNFLVFFLSFFEQWLIGLVIDFWPVSVDGRFSVAGYVAGFGFVLFLQLLSLLWLWYDRRVRLF